jgi:hypothetical protein
MYNIVFPCMMMSSLTVLVFSLPPDSGEKIALGMRSGVHNQGFLNKSSQGFQEFCLQSQWICFKDQVCAVISQTGFPE